MIATSWKRNKKQGDDTSLHIRQHVLCDFNLKKLREHIDCRVAYFCDFPSQSVPNHPSSQTGPKKIIRLSWHAISAEHLTYSIKLHTQKPVFTTIDLTFRS